MPPPQQALARAKQHSTGAIEAGKATVSHTEIIRASKVCAEGVASKRQVTHYSGIVHTAAQ